MKPSMTDPLVIPVKPKVKPVPKRETQEPKPRRGDPWTVPAPKVNPTPKAIKEDVMKEKEKMLISDKKYLEFAMGLVLIAGQDLKKSMFEKFELTDEMTKEFFKEREKVEMKKSQKDLASKHTFSMN